MRLEASAVVQPATVKKATTKAPKARITSDSTGVTAPATPAVQQTGALSSARRSPKVD